MWVGTARLRSHARFLSVVSSQLFGPRCVRLLFDGLLRGRATHTWTSGVHAESKGTKRMQATAHRAVLGVDVRGWRATTLVADGVSPACAHAPPPAAQPRHTPVDCGRTKRGSQCSSSTGAVYQATKCAIGSSLPRASFQSCGIANKLVVCKGRNVGQ